MRNIDWFTDNYIENKEQCEFLLKQAEKKYPYTKEQIFEGCKELRLCRGGKDSLKTHIEILGKMGNVGINAAIAGIKLREALMDTAKLKFKSKYKSFKEKVKYFANPEDYKDNHKNITPLSISIDDYDLFIYILKLGAEICPAIRIYKELSKISIKTKLTKKEALEVGTQFSCIYELFKVNYYKK